MCAYYESLDFFNDPNVTRGVFCDIFRHMFTRVQHRNKFEGERK